MRPRLWFWVFLLFTVIPLNGCEQHGRLAVENTNPGMTLRLTDPTNHLSTLPFRAVEALAWSGDSGLLLVDADDAQLVVESLVGDSPTRIGRKGAGPGEFMAPHEVFAGLDGRLLVADAKLMRLSLFDSQLNFVESYPLAEMPQRLVDWDGERAVLVTANPMGGGPWLRRIDLSSGEEVAGIDLFARSEELREAARAASVDGRPLPFVAAVPLPGGRVAIGETSSYRWFIFDQAGSVVGRFGRPELEPEPLSDEEKQELEDQALRSMRRVGVEMNEQIRASLDLVKNRPQPFFRTPAVTTDGAGRVWIATQRGDRDSTKVDLFGPEGEFLGTVSMRDEVIRLAVRGSRVAALVRRHGGECDGCHGVDVYEIEA